MIVVGDNINYFIVMKFFRFSIQAGSHLTVTHFQISTYNVMYRKSGNFCCRNIFVVDGGHEINLTKISVHY